MMLAVALSSLDHLLLSSVREYSVPAVLGIARIGACLAWLPYLSSGVISSRVTRSVVSLLILIGIWPVTSGVEVGSGMLGMGVSLLMEALIGTAIGLAMALPFHIFHGMGALFDNQRGAGVGAMLDPLSGVEATESATLIQLMSVVVFLMAGGMVVMLDVIVASYRIAPMGQGVHLHLDSLLSFAGTLLAGAVRMALPVIFILFLLELFLGVLSRYAQQMNAFSVSLAVKSFVGFIALLIYLVPTVREQLPALSRSIDWLQLLEQGRPQ